MDKKTKTKIILASILLIAVLAALTVVLYPYVQRLSEPEYQVQIQRWINKMGILGFFIVLGVQILQIIIAFIPGEPVELLAGALYGSIGGAALCLLGCIIASAFIFSLSKKLGAKMLDHLFSEKKMKHWQWLRDSHKNEMVTFILFFIPATPKDMLTYLAGATDMTLSRFLVITTIARIPSVLSSTMIGSTMRHGNWQVSVAVFVITGIIGIVGICFKDKIISFCQKKIKSKRPSQTK